jgi:hypothetical protein
MNVCYAPCFILPLHDLLYPTLVGSLSVRTCLPRALEERILSSLPEASLPASFTFDNLNAAA